MNADDSAAEQGEIPDPVYNLSLLLTVDEVARSLRIGKTHAHHLVGTGQIESIKVSRCRRIPREAVVTFVERLRARHSGGVV